MSNEKISEVFEEIFGKSMTSEEEINNEKKNNIEEYTFTTHGGIIDKMAAKHSILNDVIVPSVNNLLVGAGQNPDDFILDQQSLNWFMSAPLSYSYNYGTFAPIYYDCVQKDEIYRAECGVRIIQPDKSYISVSVSVLQLAKHKGVEDDENSEWEILYDDGEYYASPFCWYSIGDIVANIEREKLRF